MNINFRISSVLLLVTFVLSMMSAVACESLAPIIVENQTTETLSININNVPIGDVVPRAELKNRTVMIDPSFKIEARNAAGRVVYANKFSYEEMKKINWKIVIPARN